MIPPNDTIAAIATPPGRGGIGILRLSGPKALALAAPLLQPAPDEPFRARFCRVVEPATGAKLDEAVATWFRAPRSYTGEDVIEIAAHGSPVLLDHLLRLLLQGGARLAEPGEFTERAFLSGRLDLTQAEAVRDLIDAQTLAGAQQAAQQLGGALSRRIAPLKDELLSLIAVLEAGIDFAEDDTPVVADADLHRKLAALHAEFAALERTFAHSRLLTEGVKLAIVGRPNAGKSSLFNRLLDRERSIVTAEPGTTRDTVEERLSLAGIPVHLIDTAGLRDAVNEAERLGIARSREAFADAGLVLLVLDSTAPLHADEEALLASAAGRPLAIAFNKSDLSAVAQNRSTRLHALAPGAPVLRTSALTGAGIPELRDSLCTLLLGEGAVAPEGAMLTNLRQHTAVAAAAAALQQAHTAAQGSLPHELLLLDLYAALRELDTLTGATTPDDVLHQIFSTFCIGK